MKFRSLLIIFLDITQNPVFFLRLFAKAFLVWIKEAAGDKRKQIT